MISLEKFVYCEFLDGLRNNGTVNTFQAGRYLRLAFPHLTEDEARHILVEWMGSFKSSSEKGDAK